MPHPSQPSLRPPATRRHGSRSGPRAARTLLAAVVLSALVGVEPASAAAPSITSAAGVPGASAPASAAPTPVARPGDVARWGAGWLATQIRTHGGHLDAFGSPDPTDTAYAVVGLHAAGVGRAASAQAVAYLKTQLTDAVRYSDGSDNPGRLGYYILAAVSAGADPYHFGGHAPRNNLVRRLLATNRPGGPDAGLFGTADPTFDGAFRQGVALVALKSAGVHSTRPAVARALHWLGAQQCGNGLWVAYRADRSAPCPAADPATFAGPDTNTSGMAVQGLAAYGRHPRRSQVLARLRAVQSADGGFPYLAAPAQASDPDSTALSIQAILAEGARPGAAQWRIGPASPFTALASYQLGCTDPAADRGAFFFPGDRSPSILSTVQSVPAAAGHTLVVRPTRVSRAVPRMVCGSARPVAVTASSRRVAVGGRVTVGAAALTGTAGPCHIATGVTVFVDFTAFRAGVSTRCASSAPKTGVAALQQAGFALTGTSGYGLAFICRINNRPAPAAQSCATTPPATAYWAYYHAAKGATWWTASTVGATSYKPPAGSIEAWAFGNSARPSRTPAQVRAG